MRNRFEEYKKNVVDGAEMIAIRAGADGVMRVSDDQPQRRGGRRRVANVYDLFESVESRTDRGM
jgi:hypothetical protein